ncbi:MAG TPA: nitroreductase family protein [Chitinivibrionales bacterium]|nr:nitroreductase family protein [Chitinivibrionales bacterium]
MSSMIELIRRRVSVRTYDPMPLSDEQKASIRNICQSNTIGTFGNKCRLELIDLAEAEKAGPRRFGTYGFIKGARLFIAGVTTPAARAFLDFGYCFEKAVLELTGLGLGTCWMALTFNRQGFAKKAGLRDGEKLVIVSPVGIPSGKRSLVDVLIKITNRSRVRKPWRELFFDGDGNKPLTQGAAGRYAEALECVRLAPSGVNYQPWRIIRETPRDTFHFYAKRADAKARGELHAGIAMANFECAAQELGLKGAWRIIDGKEMPGADYFVSWIGE